MDVLYEPPGTDSRRVPQSHTRRPNQDRSQTKAVAVAVAIAVAVPTNERYLPTRYVGFTAMTQ
jgi:hypothetical protein